MTDNDLKPNLLSPLSIIRDLTQMYAMISESFYRESMWRWVLSPAMVDLLRDYAASISETAGTRSPRTVRSESMRGRS